MTSLPDDQATEERRSRWTALCFCQRGHSCTNTAAETPETAEEAERRLISSYAYLIRPRCVAKTQDMLQDGLFTFLSRLRLKGFVRFHSFQVRKSGDMDMDMVKLEGTTEFATNHDDWVHGVSFEPAGKIYVTVSGHAGENMHVYDVKDNKLLKKLNTDHHGGKIPLVLKPTRIIDCAT